MALLTDQILASGVSLNDLIHIVITGDTSQNPAGSSFKATIQQVAQVISGGTGTNGTSGSSGISGSSGSAGSSGIGGSSGSSGISGNNGTSGSSGISGSSGSNGSSGSSGVSGNDGTSGSSGISGSSGSSGINGNDGTSGSSGVSGSNGTSGSSGNTGTSGTSGISGVGVANWAAQYSDTTNQLVGEDVKTLISANTIDYEFGITLVNNSEFTVPSDGQYEFGFSAQVEKTQGGSATNVSFWISLNGNDVSGTTSTITLVSNSAYQLPFVPYILDLQAGDYIQLYVSADDANVQLTAIGTQTTPTRPSSPSIIVVFKQVGVAIGSSSGSSGSSGTSGITGSSGSSGSSGSNGTSGSSGNNGTSGTSGSNGSSGISGSSGTSGNSGSSGTSGSSGISGSSGTSGNSGSSGTSGSSGISGSSGTSGENGISGGQNLFFNSSVAQTPSPYRQLGQTTTTAPQTGITVNLTSNQQNVLVDSGWMTDPGYPDVLVIPNGIWHAYSYFTKNAINDDISYYFTVSKYSSGGTTTLLFTSDVVQIGWDQNNTNPVETKTNGVATTTLLDPSDRILVNLYVNNNQSGNKTVTFYTEGTLHYSYIVTTLSTPSGTSGSSGSSGLSGSSGTSGSSGANGSSGSSGISGTDGTSGISGIDGALSARWLFGNTYTPPAAPVVGDGKFYTDNTTISSISEFYISIIGENSVDYYTMFLKLDASPGVVATITDVTDNSILGSWDILSITDNTTNFKFVVSSTLAANGSLNPSSSYSISFSIIGGSGTSGSSGTNGVAGSTGSAGTSGSSGTSGLLSLSGNTDNGVITLNGAAPNATVESSLTYDGQTLRLLYQSGDEGGEMLLSKPVTSTSISGTGVTMDVFQNRLRFFEQGGSGRGAYIDITDMQNTVGVNLAPYRYLYVTRVTTNQTIPSGTWANTDIIFNNENISFGITYNTSTGVATLPPGIYRISATLAWSAAAVYRLEFSCYNSSNTQLGPTVQIVQSTDTTNNISNGYLDFIYRVTSQTGVKIRTTANTNAQTGESIRFDLNTSMIIQQVG